MKRLLFFILRLAIILAIAVWFVDRSGTARLVWGGYVIETSAAFIGFAALALGFVFYLLFHSWYLLRHGPASLRLRRKVTRLQQGHEHFTQGLVAVAGGDAFEAGRRAIHARRLLGTTASTQLLQAQAAQLAGDRRAAKEIFRALAAEPDSAVLGYRGLIMEARRDGNWAEAERLIEKLRRLKPETPWLNLVRFELLARRKAWDEAGEALAQAGASRLIGPGQMRKNRAAILAATAQEEMRHGHYDKALPLAEQAARQAPGWLPAILILAQTQALSGHRRAMQRTVEKNWGKHPHPQLALLLRSADTDAVEACRHIEKLCAANENAPVSRLVMAEAALDASIWGTARRHLTALIGRGEATQEAYRLMSRLERRENGDEAAALQWLTKGAEAPADPAWLCNACGGTHKEWQALCAHCGAFDSLDWQSPGKSRIADPTRELEAVGEIISP